MPRRSYTKPTFPGQLDNTGNPIQKTGGNATPLDMGAGHVRPGSAFDPGLVYESGPTEWLQYTCGIGQHLGVSDGGFSALLGLRYRVGERLWLRAGFDADAMFSTDSRRSNPLPFYSGNWGLQLGATLRLNGGRGGAQL